MGLVIDTNFFINVENNRAKMQELDSYTSYGEVYISAITAAELLLGVHLASDMAIRINRHAFVDNILRSIPSLAFDAKVARTYAEIYAYFFKPRCKATANVHDLQIAATALTYDFPILTNNIKDFKPIPGIKILALSE